jgi:uncharacterized protein YprB with RNaseH-like and TPR domain
MSKPKILIWDLETAGVNSFKADLAAVVCFGYKWLGEKHAHTLTVDQFPKWFSKEKGLNDKPLLEAALEIMEQADLLVAHYGERFDRRFYQGRCAIHHLTPPPPTKLRDTWQIARRAFGFSSNRLANLVDHLRLPFKKYQKECPDEWPGWWTAALAGDKSAIHAMAKYCREDVQALEGLYMEIRNYDYPHPRLIEDRTRCRLCGGEVQYRGICFVGEHKYRRLQCCSCGKWDRERKALAEVIDAE